MAAGAEVRNFGRYFCASVAALAVDYGLTAAGIFGGLSPYAALVMGVGAGAVTGFLLLTFWVFPTRSGSFALRRMGGYVLGVGLVYVVRALCVWLWERLGLGPEMIYLGLVFAYGCSFISNFLFQKYLVFTSRDT